MSAILRLYPQAWRERYGDELAALLEEHPASPLDQLDLIRGALDARLHPQVPGAAVPPEQEIPTQQRQLGVIAAIGGIAWILAVASLFALPVNSDGYRDSSLAFIGLTLGIAMIGIAVGEFGTRQGSPTSARTGHGIAIGSVVLSLTMLLGWPAFIIGLLGFPVLGLAASLRGAVNDTIPGWFAVIFSGAAASSILGSMIDNRDTDLGPVLILLVGLAALVLAWLAFSHRRPDTHEVTQA